MNLSKFKPFKQYSFLRRFDLQPNILELNPVVKRDPTVFKLITKQTIKAEQKRKVTKRHDTNRIFCWRVKERALPR